MKEQYLIRWYCTGCRKAEVENRDRSVCLAVEEIWAPTGNEKKDGGKLYPQGPKKD